MLKKRLLVLALMLCLLVVVSIPPSASATVYCGCAMECSGGREVCGYNCDGSGTVSEWAAAISACCQGADANTPALECGNQY